MFCQKCGHENSTAADFCSVCGHSHSQLSPPLNTAPLSNYVPPNTLSSPNHSKNLGQADTLLAAFVGEKYQSYYREKWFNGKEPRLDFKNTALSLKGFNLASLIFVWIWLSYRKMHIYSAVYLFFVSIVDVILMHVLGMESYNNLKVSPYLVSGILIPFVSNYLYLHFSIKQVKKTLAQSTDGEIAKISLEEKGGTSLGQAIGFTVLILLLSAIVRELLSPSWY